MANIFPQNSRELFNIRHSKPRNVVKSIYGLVKARYPILRDMPPEYDFNAQCNIVSSSFLPFFLYHQKLIKSLPNFQSFPVYSS